MIGFEDARGTILREVKRGRPPLRSESVSLRGCLHRVLAGEIRADRDYPPFDRSTRDGFAVRAADVESIPVQLQLIGEVRAGSIFEGVAGAGQCVQIMTGAPVPRGSDAVVMIEHTDPAAEQVTIRRSVSRGANIAPRGSEAASEDLQLSPGCLIGPAEVALLGQTGNNRVKVYQRPRVAILSTGDEIVDVSETPGPVQIRNSNCHSLAAQVSIAGGDPVVLGNGRDDESELESLFERGLEEDLLVITGGVSAGKYDFVEDVLRRLGAEFYFDSLAIRPGKPAVFGRCGGKFVFGLPGNPLSTMVTFELLVRPAIEVLSGMAASPLRYFNARLREPLEPRKSDKPDKPNVALTRFIPAVLDRDGEDLWVRPLAWKGSGDVSGVARSNCYLICEPGSKALKEGAWAKVLPRAGAPV